MLIFEEFINALDKSKPVLLTLHRSPDGDSIASNVSMSIILNNLGYKSVIYSVDPVPEYLKWLLHNIDVVVSDKAPNFNNYSGYISLDIASIEQIGYGSIELPEATFVIDHHISNLGFAKYNLIDYSLSSTCAVIYKYIQSSLHSSLANAILTGIITDTGRYEFIKDSSEFIMIADLINHGADQENIFYNLYSRNTLLECSFTSMALSKIKQVNTGTYRYVHILLDLASTSQFPDSDDLRGKLTQYTRSIENTDFGFTAYEKSPNLWKISLRSRTPEMRVVDIAAGAFHGGGGHIKAAGATFNGTQHELLITLNAFLTTYEAK
jgi:bifunctional oligoribonuclease and PAP phosphatase NrnA